MNKLKWFRLRNFKCPKCNSNLITTNSGTRAVGCEREEGCGFWMVMPVFERVVNSLYMTHKDYKPKFGDDIQSLELLNNLDRGVVPEDFSDAVYLTPDE